MSPSVPPAASAFNSRIDAKQRLLLPLPRPMTAALIMQHPLVLLLSISANPGDMNPGSMAIGKRGFRYGEAESRRRDRRRPDGRGAGAPADRGGLRGRRA